MIKIKYCTQIDILSKKKKVKKKLKLSINQATLAISVLNSGIMTNFYCSTINYRINNV